MSPLNGIRKTGSVLGRAVARSPVAAPLARTAVSQAITQRPQLEGFDPQLVIFDKDGTLIDFKFMWGKWAHTLCDRLEVDGHLRADGMDKFCEALGYNRTTGNVHNRSPLCCSPMHEIESICIDFVGSHTKLGKDKASDIISSVWSMPDPTRDAKPLTDLLQLFQHIRYGLDMKIAVCTTDDRDVTLETLNFLGLDNFVDAVLCGDENHVPPKPSPEQIFHICEKLEVHPQNAIMVGDTITDMRMGRSSKVGLTIGIPGGAGSVEDLIEHADLVLPSMNNFGRLITQLSGPKEGVPLPF